MGQVSPAFQIEMQAPNFSGIRAVFFDLDDTLCGYWDASKAGLAQALAENGVAGYTTEQLIREWAIAFREFAPSLKKTGWYDTYLKSGEATRTEQMRLMLARVGVTAPEHAARLSHAYMTNRDKNLTLFPDAIDVLDRISARFPLGLITNGPADVQRQEIETLQIKSYFDGRVFIEGELEIGKPAQIVFDKAAESVGLHPNQILMVGNSYHHDIKPAIAYGWKTAWIRRPSDVPPSADAEYTQPEQLAEGEPIPDVIINHLSELLPLLPL